MLIIRDPQLLTMTVIDHWVFLFDSSRTALASVQHILLAEVSLWCTGFQFQSWLITLNCVPWSNKIQRNEHICNRLTWALPCVPVLNTPQHFSVLNLMKLNNLCHFQKKKNHMSFLSGAFLFKFTAIFGQPFFLLGENHPFCCGKQSDVYMGMCMCH